MVLRRVWCACGVEGARSRLQGSAIAAVRSCLGLNCTWSHSCGCVVDRYDVLKWGIVGGGSTLLKGKRRALGNGESYFSRCVAWVPMDACSCL
jgi:hypothetical protein